MSSACLLASASSSASSMNVFQLGNYTVSVFPVNPQSTVSPLTVPLLIGTPTEEGEFPILVFLHGFMLENSFYSQLIQHIASHGFIVVAPQLFEIDEMESAKGVTEWLSNGLGSVLPPMVRPNLSKAALGGHSRGGKLAFALALSYTSNPPSSNGDTSLIKYSALVGIDPVEGPRKGMQLPPVVLTYVPRSFDLDMAALVVGSGLGEKRTSALIHACAPKGVNHKEYFNECQSPAYHFLVKDYGHMDTLDDVTRGVKGLATYRACKSGKSREPMRRFVGGITIAFMKAYLEGDHGHLNAIKDGKDISLPVELETVEFLKD
ncbi:chlorophyllase-2, chloroplastic-like [Papaver somniferum]|nr:chlorophyllase-2, chloroplastic-like [Papaver somniferum]